MKQVMLMVLIVVLMSGCSYKANYSPVTREKPPHKSTKVGVYVLNSTIAIENNVDVGALDGMGYAMSQCAVGGNEIGALVTIVCLPFAAVAGAGLGIQEGTQLKNIKKEKGTVSANLDSRYIKQQVDNKILAYVQENLPESNIVKENEITVRNDGSIDYTGLYKSGIETVVEYSKVKIRLEEFRFEDTPIYLTLEANSRLIDTQDNRVLDEYRINVNSGVQKYVKWVENDFALLKTELEELLSRAVTDSIDEYFLLYYPTFSENMIPMRREVPFYVLAPLYPLPKLQFGGFGERVMGRPNHYFRQVEEENPKFQWEAFPWEFDTVDKKRFDNITYDLKIYRYPGLLAHKRFGIVGNAYQLDNPLLKGERYQWTVRAHFELDGKSRVTEWSGLYNHFTPRWEQSDHWLMRRNPLYKKADYYPFEIKEE